MEEMANHGGEEVLAPPSLPPPLGPCPWLVSTDWPCGKQQTFYDNISGSSETYCTSIPALEDKEVLSCFYGWLVLYDHTNKLLSFCNSTTFDDVVVLPRLRQVSDHGVSICVLVPNKNLTCFNNLDNFKIVIFLKEFPAIMCGRIGAEDKEWTETRYWKYIKPCFPEDWPERSLSLKSPFKGDNRIIMIFTRAVVCGGKIFAKLGTIYFLGDVSLLWSIEIVEDEGEEDGVFSVRLVFSRIEVPCHPFNSDKRMNLDTMEWERIKYIDDRAFFLGKNYCVSCPVSVFGSNSIYFTTKRKDGNLYCFHMKDHSVSVTPLSSTPWLRHPIWIMPRLLPRPEDDDHNNINHQRKNSTTTAITSSVPELDETIDEHRQLRNLPFDVLEHLASKHLIAKDYMNFRAAGSLFRSVAPPVNWRRALSGSSEADNVFPCPLLMFADQDERVYKFVDPSINNINNNHYLMKIPNPLLNLNIRYSSQGWLLLSEIDNDAALLYNPFTRDIMSYYCIHSFTECIFFIPNSSGIGTDDAHSFCSVIGVEFPNEDVIVVTTIDGPGEDDWDCCSCESDLNFEVVIQTCPVLFEDAFYLLDREGNLGKLGIDLETGDCSWEVLDKPRKPSFSNCVGFSFHHNFLVECGGELISVFLGSVGKWIAIYKLNGDRDWERVTNLGSYDLYLSITSCLSVRSNEGGNKIYFPALRGSEIIYFSLNTGKWHFCGSQDSASDICGTRWLVNSCWIKPTW